MGLIRAVQFYVLIFGAMLSHPALAETTLQRLAWPEQSQCRACATLQFGVLEMTLPPDIAGKLFVATVGSPVIHIMPVGARDSRTGAALMWKSRDEYLAPYRALSLPAAARSNPEEFFDMLGQVRSLTESVARVRAVEGIARAARYTKASKGLLLAYRIEGSGVNTSYLHIVVRGGDEIYTLAGTISDELYTSLLANMRVAEMP